ncbi:MAG: exodeoxyribonuclease VII large subunit, partial [Bacteroidota bacterium]|nr:exodeoxyribonuclease VII large subunit [Bacteroidota bacterium]
MDARLTLSELNMLVRDVLQDAFSETIWVIAEIAELKQNQSGHCYLELIEKDELTDTVTARSRATIWGYTYRMLKPYFESTTGHQLAAGIKVLLNVTVEFHEVYGFSLNVRDIDPTYTLGDLARKRAEIIARLEREGVLTMNKELSMPLIPKNIAVISSPTAAGLGDFMDQLDKNPYKYRFYTRLFPALMQGAGAEASIISALEQIYELE